MNMNYDFPRQGECPLCKKDEFDLKTHVRDGHLNAGHEAELVTYLILQVRELTRRLDKIHDASQ
jgi:hypothetical protein